MRFVALAPGEHMRCRVRPLKVAICYITADGSHRR